MKSDLYRLSRKYRGAPSKRRIRRRFDEGGLNDLAASYNDGSGQADPADGEGSDVTTGGASSAAPPPARVTIPAASGNRTMDLESLLQRYATPTTNYGAQLAQAQQTARSETEAFSNAVRQMAERSDSPTSRAEMYFRLAAAFGAPTKTGRFAENLSLVGKEMSEYAKGRRSEEADRRALGLRAQELRMTGARQDLASLQTLAGQEAAERRAINSKVIEAYLRGNQPSARETRINDMMSTYGIDRQAASRLVDNVDSVVADSVTGTPMLVNRTTGESRPVTTAGPSLAAPTAATPTTAAAPAAAGSGTARPADIEGARPVASLYDLARTPFTTGVGPAAAENAQRVLGQAGVNVVSPEFTERRQTFANFQNDIIRSVINNPRFPVAEQERIRKEINIEPSALTDPQTLVARIRTLDTTLRSSLANREREGADTSLPVTARREALQAANNIRNLLITFGVPQEREEAAPPRRQRPTTRNTQIPQVGQVVDGYTFTGGDPSDQNNWSRE